MKHLFLMQPGMLTKIKIPESTSLSHNVEFNSGGFVLKKKIKKQKKLVFWFPILTGFVGTKIIARKKITHLR